MKHSLKRSKQSQTPGAQVVDGKLILSFPYAVTPVVWQMDLDQVKASALEVQANADAATHALVLKTAATATMTIATFENREQAVAGLMAAAAALENAHGQIRPRAANDGGVTPFYRQGKKKSGWKKFFSIAGMLLLVFILFNIWVALSPRPPAGYDQTSTNAPAVGRAQDSAGVPVSADDFLNNR